MERHSAAGTGQPIAVDGVQVRIEVDPGELLGQQRQAVPVGAAFITIKQPGTGQGIGSGAQGAHLRTTLRLFAEPAEIRLGDTLLNIDAAHDNYEIELDVISQGVIELDAHAVTGDLLALPGADQAPAIELAIRQRIGDAERIDRAGQ